MFYDADDAGTEYKLWQDTYERIMPGAFDRAIQEDDVRSLFNHDDNFVLGRKKAGTLSLSVDSVGLRYEVTPPDSGTIRDLVLSPIQRGDVDGSSFMFVPKRVAWVQEERDDRQVDIRQIEEVELWELGPVTFPAYKSATSGVRSAELKEIQAERDGIRRVEESELRKRDAIRVRARLVETGLTD